MHLQHSRDSRFRVVTAAILATCSQNNPFVQDALLDAHLLPVLLEMLVNTNEEPVVMSERLQLRSIAGSEMRGFHRDFLQYSRLPGRDSFILR